MGTRNPSLIPPKAQPASLGLSNGGTTMLAHLATNDEGATAIEYGLIAALISLVCVIAFQSLGLNLADIFTTISDALAGR